MHVLLGMCGTSILVAMLYRFAAIRQREDLLRRPSYITALGVFQVLCTVPCMVAYSRAITSAVENAEDVRNVRKLDALRGCPEMHDALGALFYPLFPPPPVGRTAARQDFAGNNRRSLKLIGRFLLDLPPFPVTPE